ncbi:MAG TPA: tetratricopeptide repeat protein [Thermoanaerobaculia bacterium]|nr:tetratricopeptide repeat protein [Thermoanaerobaculia bacterium]
MADSSSWMGDLRRNRYRVLLWSSLCAALAISVWLSGAGSWFPAERERPQPPSRSGEETLLAMAPADLPVAVRERYRLQPDRRLLAAVAAVHRLQTGTKPELVKAEWVDGRWRLLAGSDEVGVLSELPGFEEATDLLARWASGLPSAPAAAGSPGSDLAGIEGSIQAVDAAALLEALSSLGGSPADLRRDPAKMRSITSGLAWLSTMTVDHLEQADVLLGEAWAWVVIARASGATPDAGSEPLIARALGYEAAAAQAAASLVQDDPVRLYAESDEARLGALCARRKTDRSCHFLRLALLAERSQDERFRAALQGSPFRNERSLALRGLETRLSDFDGGNAGSDLAELAIQAVSLPAGPDEASVEARTRDFEAAVDRLAERGGLVDRAAVQAAYRAPFYSGLFDEARFMIDQYASGSAAQDLAASIATPAAGTAEELRRWIEVNGPVLDGSRDMRPAANLLASARSIGVAPLFDLSVVITKHVASTDPLRRGPIPALFERMDTRPSHRVMAARVADRSLTSPGLFEKLASAAAEAAPHQSEELPAQVAELRADTARLREIAGDPAMPSYAQVVALDTLASLGKADDAFVRSRYEAIAADPDEGPDYLVDFLEERGDLAGAVAAVEAALKRSRDPLVSAHYQTEKARLLLKMGNAERAFAAVQPALDSYKEEALLQGAAIELARKHPDRALELAQAALDRYPDRSSETSGLIARARWQQNQYAVAAKELAESRNGIVGPWNRHLPEAFAETFATAPEEQARRAFSELAAAGIVPHVLASVAVALGKKGDLAVALELLEGLRDPAPEWQDQIRFATYDLIKEKSGPDAALAWVRKTVPDRSHNFALTLYQMRRYDLLLGLFANGETSTSPGIVRMIKAASHLHLRETSGPRWDGLVAEIAKDPADDFFARAARYLVGKTDEAKVFETFPHDGDLASIGWIQGVKAASEGRFTDADSWFQVALESGMQQQPPHAWSWVIESEWLQAERSLEVLEKKGEF